MKSNIKSFALLSLLVMTIYVMRDGDLSFTKSLSRPVFRMLYNYARPASATCDGVSFNSTFSDADLARAQNLQTSLAASRGGNKLEIAIGSGFNGSAIVDYAMTLIPGAAVWAAFFVISIILCCCGICNWCCMFGCCKNGKCCKCCKKPTTTKKRKVYAIITLVLMTGVFSAGIAGAVFSSNVSNGMLVSYCSIMNFIEDLAYGNQPSKWLGLAGIISSTQAFLSNFDSTVTNIQPVTATTGTFTSTRSAVKSACDQFTSNYASQQLPRADPANSGNYKPDFVNNIGSTTDSGKYMNLIMNEIDVKVSNLVNSVSPINSAINSIKSQKDSIKSATNSAISSGNSALNSINNLFNSLNDAGSTVNNIISIVGKVILAIFIVYIVVGILPILSILLILILKIKFFSKILHVSWCLLGLLCFIGFLISAIFYPISIVFVETCGVIGNTLNSQSYFNSTLGPAIGAGTAKNIMYTCLYGDGLALNQLGLNQSLGYFDTIYKQLNTINSTSPFTASRPIPSVIIPQESLILDQTRKGYIPDAGVTTTDLNTLNSLTNSNNGGTCTPDQDTWITSGTNCSSIQGTVFQSNSAGSFNKPSATCIGLDNWKTAAHPASDRYGSGDFPSSCPNKNNQDQLSYVKQFVDNFRTQNTPQMQTLFTNMYTDMSTNTANSKYITYQEAQFGGLLYDQMASFRSLVSALASVTDFLNGPANGLLPNTNCQFIGADLRLFYNAFCTGFITSIYQATVVLIIVSMFSFFGAIMVMCTAKRINNEDGAGNNNHAKQVSPGFNNYQ